MRTKEEILQEEAEKDYEYYQDGIYNGGTCAIFRAMDTHLKQMAMAFLDRISEYEHESGEPIWLDERSSVELFEIFITKQDENIHN